MSDDLGLLDTSTATHPAEPTPEHPTAAQLEAYGDFAFLYLRSETHKTVQLQIARRMIQPPIDLSFYKLFRFDGVPRVGITWAFLGPEQERRFLDGELLEPAEWRSGPRMWVMEIIAPYGQKSGGMAMNWLRKSLPQKIKRVRYMRLGRDGRSKRVIEVNRGAGKIWGAKLVDPAAFNP